MTSLSGWRVLLPRQTGRESALLSLLRAEGAVAQAIPMITIESAPDSGALDLAILSLAAGDFSWVGFSSVNAVSAVLSRAGELHLSPAIPADTRCAAVGPATSRALRAASALVDLTPEHGGSAAALVTIWPAAHPGESVLLPQSEIAATTLADRLTDKGYRVHAVTAYRTVPTPAPASVAADLAAGAFEAVLFTSPSTVAALAAVRIAPGTMIGAIGSTTAQAAAAAGLTVSFTADAPTDQALVHALAVAADRSRRKREP